MSNKLQAISAGHEVTLEVAKQILQDGGNAMDAAIAAYAAACVAEPCMASAGAGAFANIYQVGEAPIVLDFFCQTPKQKNSNEALDFFPIPIDFGDAQETYYGGLAAMAVPGAIAGMYAMHETWSTRPMNVLLAPAMQLAKEGVLINPFQHYDLSLLDSIFDHRERAQALFKPEGTLIGIGDRLSLPMFADFLDHLSLEGPRLFYEGEPAQHLVNDSKEQGGFLRMADFADYKVIYRKPLRSQLANHQIFSNPLPAIGGALLAVGIERLAQQKQPAAHKVLGCFEEMEKMEKNVGRLSAYLEGRNRRGATSHFNIVDRWGNAVALTMSLGEGSGYFIPGTDIHMNNMLGEQSLVPNGWHSWKEDTRLSTMMCPTLAFDDSDVLKLVMGSGGASRIPGALMQVLRYHLIDKMKIENAVPAPRMHVENSQLDAEPNFPVHWESLDPSLQAKSWSRQSMFFGGVHAIACDREALFAIGDSRRDGVAWVG